MFLNGQFLGNGDIKKFYSYPQRGDLYPYQINGCKLALNALTAKDGNILTGNNGPWTDLSPNINNGTLTNFTGTSASGWVNEWIENQTGAPYNMSNALNIYGNFETDLTYWTSGGGSGTMEISTNQAKFDSKSLRCAYLSTGNAIYKDISSNNGDKWHVCGWYYRVSGTTTSDVYRVFDYGGANSVTIVSGAELNATTATWTYDSVEKTAANGGVRIYLSSTDSQTVEYHLDGIMAFNKTSIFGAGNEPSTAEMDKIIRRANYRYGYISEKTMLLSRKPILRFDGTDDILSFVNTGSLDLGSTAGKEQYWALIFRQPISINNGYLFGRTNTDNTRPWYTYTKGSTQQVIFGFNGADLSTLSVVQNEFFSFVVYKHGTTVNVYINGSLVDTKTTAATTALQVSDKITCGAKYSAGAYGSFARADVASISVGEATTLDINTILKAEMTLSKHYIASTT